MIGCEQVCQALNDNAQEIATLRQQRADALRAISAWQEIARQNQRNTDYYRGLVEQIGEMFGQEARTADDGSIHDSVLCAKVPELVKAEREKVQALAARNARLAAALEWYADDDSWVIQGDDKADIDRIPAFDDVGRRAQAALATDDLTGAVEASERNHADA